MTCPQKLFQVLNLEYKVGPGLIEVVRKKRLTYKHRHIYTSIYSAEHSLLLKSIFDLAYGSG